MAKPLAQVTDVEALDAHEGTCARLLITVPSAWTGATLSIAAPRRMTCGRCDGGGCDSCARSGALQAPDERQLRLTLPALTDQGALIRIPAPFADPSIEQLIVEVTIGDAASSGVSRISAASRALAVPSPTQPPALVIALALVLVIALGVLIAMR